jgi:hypothetical protein
VSSSAAGIPYITVHRHTRVENSQNLCAYASWSLDEVPIPPRSALYRLEPIGLGTPLVESLTSYVTRLAQEHCLMVGRLIGSVVAPLIGKPYLLNTQDAACMNKSHLIASDFVRTLEALTEYSGLEHLTLRPLSSLFVRPGLSRPRRAWCPACYDDQNEQAKTIYDPLLWVLKEVNACTVHRRLLESRCPHCGAEERWLERRTIPGHCSKCGRWLGLRTEERMADGDDEPDRPFTFALWTSKSLLDILGAFSRSTIFATPEQIQKSLKEIMKTGYRGIQPEIKGSGSRDGSGGRRRIHPLRAILHISYGLNVTPLDFLTGGLRASELELPSRALKKPKFVYKRPNWEEIHENFKLLMLAKPPLSLPQIESRLKAQYGLSWISVPLCKRFPQFQGMLKRRRADQRRARHANLTRKLGAIVRREFQPPPSLAQAARLAGLRDHRFYDRNLPRQLCETIVRRHNLWKEEKRQKIEAEVKEAALTLHARGIYPSFPKVSELLKTPSHLVRERYRKVLREVQRELGYHL